MLRSWLSSGSSGFPGGQGPVFSGSLVLYLLRGAFGAIIIGMAWLAFDYFNRPPVSDATGGIVAFIAILAIGSLVVAGDMLVRSKQITTISAVYFGLLLGL